MKHIKLTQDLAPNYEGDVMYVDDVSAERVVKAGVGVIVDAAGDAPKVEDEPKASAAKVARASTGQTVTTVAAPQ